MDSHRRALEHACPGRNPAAHASQEHAIQPLKQALKPSRAAQSWRAFLCAPTCWKCKHVQVFFAAEAPGPALQPGGLVHQPIKHSEPLHSGSALGFVRRYYCSMFLPKFSPCLWSHTRRSPGTLWYAFTDCTAALCCPPPPTAPPPPSESLIRLQCSATRCVYTLAAPPALILVCAPRSCFHFYTSLEDPPRAR